LVLATTFLRKQVLLGMIAGDRDPLRLARQKREIAHGAIRLVPMHEAATLDRLPTLALLQDGFDVE
jgi:hypothetical protein